MSNGENIRLISRDEARRVINEHLTICPLATADVVDRIRILELSYARLIGFMTGSGILSGASFFALSKLFP